MPADTRPIAIALMGPTASGKTALSIAWARAFDGEVVSVDSALVYRGLDIGAAKPSLDERAGIVHHMIDTHDPWQRCSAAEFAQGARVAMEGITARSRLPILVGGTGLYFRALLEGLAAMPDADDAMRANIAAQARRSGWPALHAELASVDPEAARRIHVTDAQRIARALEVHGLSGKPISQWHGEAVHARLPWRVLKIVVAPRERATLHGRIATRIDAMLAAGLLEEVRRLRDLPQLRALGASEREGLPALRAVGYRQALEHIDNDSTPAEFRDRAIFATRQLAKRQLTWLRGQLDAQRFDPQIDAESLQGAVQRFVQPHRAVAAQAGGRALVV